MFEQVKKLIQLINPAPLLQPIPMPNGNGHTFAVHRDYTTKVDPGPEMSRPAHTFHSVDSFARFVNREEGAGRIDGLRATVLVGERSIVADVDAYDPHAPQVACMLKSHPLWSKWQSLCNQWVSSADMFDHLRALQSTFGSTKMRVDGKPKMVAAGPSIVDSMRRVQVSSGGDIRVERGRGGMATLTSNSNNTTVQTDLVDEWPLHLAVFEGAPDLMVDVQVLVSWRYDKDEKDLQFRISIPLASMAENAARQLVVERLQELMPWAQVGAGAASVTLYRPG